MVSWQELRDYIKWIQKERNLADRTINTAILQLRFFTIYVLHNPWDDNQLPKRKFDVSKVKNKTPPKVCETFGGVSL